MDDKRGVLRGNATGEHIECIIGDDLVAQPRPGVDRDKLLLQFLRALAPDACFRCPACIGGPSGSTTRYCSIDRTVNITHALGSCEVADNCPVQRALKGEK